MKKLITFSLIVTVIGLMANCSPKTAKNVAKTETKDKAPNREVPVASSPTGTQDVAQLSQGERTNEEQIKMLTQVNTQRLESGKQLYETSCKKCHELHSPASRTADGWVQIMKEMGVKAKLEQGPYLMISAYLIKNAKG